jgi:hypothetical protein
MEWFLSKQAVIVAATALILAIASLIRAGADVIKAVVRLVEIFRRLFKGQGRTPEAEEEKERIMLRRGWLVAIGVLLTLVATAIFVGIVIAQSALPLNARLTKEAWDAFNRKEWHTAIQKADECISQFQDQADDMQTQLEKSGVTVPTGTVSKQEKDQILKRGPLNDVGTALWIKGQAAEKLGMNEEAKQAYQSASKYTFARCYDASYDGFWAPADTAKGRLKHLK